jgi:hypothetical protein
VKPYCLRNADYAVFFIYVNDAFPVNAFIFWATNYEDTEDAYIVRRKIRITGFNI